MSFDCSVRLVPLFFATRKGTDITRSHTRLITSTNRTLPLCTVRMKIVILLVLLCTTISTYAVNTCLQGCQFKDDYVTLGELSLFGCGISDEDVESGDLASCFDEVGRGNIKTLVLTGNILTILPDGIFQGLSSLKRFEVANNELEAISEGVFQGTSELKHLVLDQNDFSTLPEGLFKGLASLDDLSLGNCNFRTLPSNIFDDLASLTELSLADNDLASLPEDIFDGLTSLEELTISGNPLECLPTSNATVLSADDGVPDCGVAIMSVATLGATGGSVASLLLTGVATIAIIFV